MLFYDSSVTDQRTCYNLYSLLIIFESFLTFISDREVIKRLKNARTTGVNGSQNTWDKF